MKFIKIFLLQECFTRTIVILGFFCCIGCARENIEPSALNPVIRNAQMDSILAAVPPADIDIDALVLPDGNNVRQFLTSINPALDSLFPRDDNHPFYGTTGDSLKNLIITYMMARAVTATYAYPGQFPGNGNMQPTQDKLGYAFGSRQTDFRTAGINSLPGCPEIYGLDEEGFIVHIMEGSFLTLPTRFYPRDITEYNMALAFTGLAHELEFVQLEDISQENILPGDIFVLITDTPDTTYFEHYGLVLSDSEDPDELILADCFADVFNEECKTDIGINIGPRLVSLNYLINDITNIAYTEHKVIRLKKKFYQPFTGQSDPGIQANVIRYGNTIWMAEDLNINGQELFQWDDLDLENFPSRGICPNGWHLPTKDEWKELFLELNAAQFPWPTTQGRLTYHFPGIGRFMKSANGWNPPGTNLYGFNVEPKGYLHVDGMTREGMGQFMGYWTSTESGPDAAYSIVFEDTLDHILMDPADLKTLGFGCRCVKDLPGQATDCLKIPIVVHFLKCSAQPLHRINNADISPIYDQIRFLNNLFSFSDYCIEFYLACENNQPVFETHDICDGSFSYLDPAKYLHLVDSVKYKAAFMLDSIVSQIQTPGFRWSPDEYINVYIAITGNGAVSSQPGFAFRRDGIVMPLQWIGGEQVAYDDGNKARTMSLAHEIGHYFNLEHPWEPVDLTLLRSGPAQCVNINNGIADLTPIYGDVFAPMVMSCVTMQQIANDNIMSYADYQVATVFTSGQIQAIRDILMTPAASNGRAELVHSTRECIDE